MRFSQRTGIVGVRNTIQIESIDLVLENRLWNAILNHFIDKINNNSPHGQNSVLGEIYIIIWTDFFARRIDDIPKFDTGKVYTNGVLVKLKEWYFKSKWYEKYDFIEYLASLDRTANLYTQFSEYCNAALKREMAGYRIIDNKVVQITSEEEVAEIERAFTNTSIWRPVNTHLTAALEFLSNRENPDYRNSVKESISAVEALCVIITGDNSTTLGKALSEIEKKYQIHAALKKAFSALYGYTSDAGGIRHSLLEDDIAVTMEDAKFMLVSCSAFINYLKVRIEK